MAFLTEAANRGSIATGYDIDNSLKFESDNSEYLHRTPSSSGSETTWTASMWVKRTELGSDQVGIGARESASITDFWRFKSDDKIRFHVYNYPSSEVYYADTDAVFRDTSAWYHVVLTLDSTNADGSERLKLFVNGIEQTANWLGSASESERFKENGQSSFLGQYKMQIGKATYTNGHYFNGYIAEVNVLDGIAAEPTDFGEYDEDSGIWKPKAYTGSYGTNGFYLDFESSGSLGADSSGNGNNFTLNNITSADQATDTPTNNFCTLNPLWTFGNTMGVSDGGTKVNNTVIAWGGAKGSIGVNSGKWYWEHGSFSGNDTMFGIQNQAGGGNTQAYLDPYTLAIQANSNVIQFTDPSNRTEAFSKTFSVSDIWGVALDLDANTIAYYRNGSIVNSAFSIDGLIGNGEFFPFVTHYGSGLNSRVNFGGYTGITISSGNSDENGYGNFEYAPPSGYYALCTKNLAEYG
jgi:hypothetical protein